METIGPITIEAVRAARAHIDGFAVRTPLVPLGPLDRGSLWLKLECLQPIGSFKIRGAANALAAAHPETLRDGVYTASAGNMAQGVAYAARRRGLPCRVVVPDSAPTTKLEAIERLGGVVVPVPYDDWWRALEEHGHPGERGAFIHPVSDPHVIAGNGTVGLELLEELPNLRAVVVPFGGGGLTCGIASAVKALSPGVRVYAAEVSTAAPLTAALGAGHPVRIERRPSFVDGIGGNTVLAAMWPLASSLVDDTIVVTPEEICSSLRRIVESVHVIAEGAGASALAAATRRPELGADGGDVVAVVSGGNLDTEVLRRILAGDCPG